MPPPPVPPRIVLLGAGGLLGTAFRRMWGGRPEMELVEFSRADLNLANPDLIRSVLEREEFDVLINGAAYTRVDDAELEPGLARAVNARAAGILAEICAARKARMVHFSTDYVFDGAGSVPYREEDEPAPLCAYGSSKLEGERLVLAASPDHLVIRLSWLFGPGRDAFPEWVLRQAERRDELRLVSDKSACPTFNLDVVHWVEALLFPEPGGGLPPSGILHLCNPPACTWLEYGEYVLEVARRTGRLQRNVRTIPVPLDSLSGFTAQRPLQSALSTDRFQRLTGTRPRSWQEAVEAHLSAGL